MSFWCCSKADLNSFLKQAAPLDRFTYYTGHLTETLVGRALAAEMYKHATKGTVYLVQQRSRLSLGFDYIVIKASPKPVVSLVPFTDEKIREIETRTKRVRQYVRQL